MKREAILCPFHEEKTPSCALDHDIMRFHCFGCRIDGRIEYSTPPLVILHPDTKTVVAKFGKE